MVKKNASDEVRLGEALMIKMAHNDIAYSPTHAVCRLIDWEPQRAISQVGPDVLLDLQNNCHLKT